VTENGRSPIWNIANSILAILAAALGFFATQLWNQGQKLAELMAEIGAHEKNDDHTQIVINRIEERQEINTKTVQINTAEITELDRRVDRVESDEVRRLQTQIDELKSQLSPKSK